MEAAGHRGGGRPRDRLRAPRRPGGEPVGELGGEDPTAVLLVAIVLLVLGVTVFPAVLAVAQGLLLAGVLLHVAAGLGYIVAARRRPI